MKSEILYTRVLAFFALSIGLWASARTRHGWGADFDYVMSTIFLIAAVVTQVDAWKERRRERKAEALMKKVWRR